jgi:hypothetical protein
MQFLNRALVVGLLASAAMAVPPAFAQDKGAASAGSGEISRDSGGGDFKFGRAKRSPCRNSTTRKAVTSLPMPPRQRSPCR